MSSISKARGMLGFALGALMAAVGPALGSEPAVSAQSRLAGGLKRRAVRSFKKTSRTSKASKSSGRIKPMIWVGGQWIFFRP